jgi:hypothetical protein
LSYLSQTIPNSAKFYGITPQLYILELHLINPAMKNFAIILFMSALLTASITGCQPAKDANEETETSTAGDTSSTDDMNMASAVYTCSMHPEVISDKPGTCSKCGMDLVKKEDGDEHTHGDSTEHNH